MAIKSSSSRGIPGSPGMTPSTCDWEVERVRASAEGVAIACPRRSFPPDAHQRTARLPDAKVSDTSIAVREGSLRSEYQHLYPGIQAGVWYIAASLTSAVGVGQERGSGRVLSDLHFEFKGGDEFGLRPVDARTRTEDTSGG